MKIYVICNKNEEMKIRESTKGSLNFYFIDPTTSKGIKEARSLKSHWAARKDPFALIEENNKPIKAFYSEAEDVITNLIKYLNEKM